MFKPNQKRIDRGLWWDRAWSLVEGCTPVSPACKNCWSADATAMRVCQDNEKIKARYGGLIVPRSKPPTFNGKIRLMHNDLRKPTPRQKPAVWSVWNDLFHKDVPIEFQYKAFERMLLCPQHFFIVCTKRADALLPVRMESLWFQLGRNYGLIKGETDGYPFPLKNVMAMTTAENQEQADKRIPHLLKADFAYRGLSVEPMLGPVDISYFKCPDCGLVYHYKQSRKAVRLNCPECWTEIPCDELHNHRAKLDWVIAGPETGPGARECKPEWIEDLYEQCKAAGVPFFDKRKDYLAREFPK